jgi:outer membrane protein assembly factor BamA
MNARQRTRTATWSLALGLALLVSVYARDFAHPGPVQVAVPQAPSTHIFVADVIIRGNQLMASDRIKSGLLTRAGQEYNRDIIAEDVRRLVASKQFDHVEVRQSFDPSGNIIVFFRVSDYTNVVRRVVFVGAKHLSDKELYDLAGVREGTPLSPTRNKLACGAIIRKLQEMGRPYADCVLISGDKVGDDEVIFEITEGTPYTFAEPPPWGSKSIGLVPIQAKVKEGEFFDQRATDYSGRSARVSVTPLYNPGDAGTIRVVYDVEEQAPAHPNRVIVIGPCSK